MGVPKFHFRISIMQVSADLPFVLGGLALSNQNVHILILAFGVPKLPIYHPVFAVPDSRPLSVVDTAIGCHSPPPPWSTTTNTTTRSNVCVYILNGKMVGPNRDLNPGPVTFKHLLIFREGE